jgi:hypothetical protein
MYFELVGAVVYLRLVCYPDCSLRAVRDLRSQSRLRQVADDVVQACRVSTVKELGVGSQQRGDVPGEMRQVHQLAHSLPPASGNSWGAGLVEALEELTNIGEIELAAPKEVAARDEE